jgi:small subunit ribosomal protein S6
MTKRVYESAVLINAALEDDGIQTVVLRIKETISSNGGAVLDVEDWGRKRLAYIVKKSKIGYYVFFRIDAPPDLIPKLERFYQLDDNILRYLTIKLSSEALEQIEIDKAQQKEKTEESDELIVPSSDTENEEEENNAVEQPINNDSMEDK